MLLYEHPLSSYARKVKSVLRENRIAFDRLLPDDLGTGRPGGRLATATRAPRCRYWSTVTRPSSKAR